MWYDQVTIRTVTEVTLRLVPPNLTRLPNSEVCKVSKGQLAKLGVRGVGILL